MPDVTSPALLTKDSRDHQRICGCIGCNAGMDTSASVRVRGIYCAACIGKILDALRDLPGSAWVSLGDIRDGQATVHIPDIVSPAAIERALAKAGFSSRRAESVVPHPQLGSIPSRVTARKSTPRVLKARRP